MRRDRKCDCIKVGETEWAWRLEWWQIYRRYELKNLKGGTAFKSSIHVYLTEYFVDSCFIQRLCKHLGLQCHVTETWRLWWFDCDDDDDDYDDKNTNNYYLFSLQSTHLVYLHRCPASIRFPAVHIYAFRFSSSRYAVSFSFRNLYLNKFLLTEILILFDFFTWYFFLYKTSLVLVEITVLLQIVSSFVHND